MRAGLNRPSAAPSKASDTDREPAVEVSDLSVHFAAAGLEGPLRAVDRVSFSIPKGKTLGLVGESGSGKTTLARAVLGLHKPLFGAVRIFGKDIAHLSKAEHKCVRQQMQAVFQDPYASLNPFKTIRSIIVKPLKLHDIVERPAREARVAELLSLVGLDRSFADRYPRDFSGGQRQRIAIARALAPDPSVLVLDEPLSSLDVSVQAQIVNLLLDLKEQLGLTYLFIAHDLSVVRLMSDHVVVMYSGQVMEQAPADALFAHPLHPYTLALISSVPIPDPTRGRRLLDVSLREPLAAANVSSGCRFRTRCPFVMTRCEAEQPPLVEAQPDHFVSCHFWEEIRSSERRAGSMAAPPNAARAD